MRGERSDAEGPISGSGANNASARLTGIGYGPAEARPMIASLGVAPTREARLEDDRG